VRSIKLKILEAEHRTEQEVKGMYYAVQISPEAQEWAFDFDIRDDEGFNNDFAIYGNRDFGGYKPERIEKLIDSYERGYIEEALFDPKNSYYNEWKNSTEAMNELCPKDNGKSWSGREIKAMRDSIKNITNRASSYHNDVDVMADLMSIITGHKWERRTISGCSQSDWNELIYDTERISKEYANIIEKAYFNECSEWMVIDDDLNEGLSAEEVQEHYYNGTCGFCGFAYDWTAEGIRKEIADMLGVKPEQVTMYRHDGYTRTSKYKLVA
jgi:hypothetical protein